MFTSHSFNLLFLSVLVSRIDAKISATWPSPQYNALDDLLYEESLDGLVHTCGDGPNNRSTTAEWLRFAYHDSSTRDIDTDTGGLDASLFFELDQPENVGAGNLESAFVFLNFANKYISLADVVAAGAVLAVNSCGGPVLPFRAGRIDAQEAGPAGVPQPQDTLASHTESFRRQGFSPSEMIALVACGHTTGGVRNPDFPTLVQPATNGLDNILSFDTTPTFDNTIVTQYLNSTTQNVLVVSPNKTMTSDLRIFSSDNDVTMTGMMSPSNFTATCSSLLERMINNVPSTVVLSDAITPLDIKITGFSLVPTSKSTFQMSFTLRLLHPPTGHATLSIKWDENGKACSSCSATPLNSDPPSGSALMTTLGFQPFNFHFNASINAPSSKFWFEIDPKNGSAPVVLDNGGNGFVVPQAFLFIPSESFSLINQNDESSGVNVTVAVPEDSTPSSVFGTAFQRTPVEPPNFNIPLKPFNETFNLVRNTWTTPIPGWHLYTGTGPLGSGQQNGAVDLAMFAVINGTTYSVEGISSNSLRPVGISGVKA